MLGNFPDFSPYTDRVFDMRLLRVHDNKLYCQNDELQSKVFDATDGFNPQIEDIGKRGYLDRKLNGWIFEAYCDQSLARHRAYDGEYELAWTCADREDSPFRVPRMIVPGWRGQFVISSSSHRFIDIPQEFQELCQDLVYDPVPLLQRFMADLCSLSHSKACPREDQFSALSPEATRRARHYWELIAPRQPRLS
ncbi:MAG TPA: hypothetical protein VE954_30785 [Oligoflexus sp.]|uniref:hypothetical protein n=1 Tax=Oligoflexus sp. TaxID=1971216 RepID=UPI002D4CB45D|nr:hypothetical protein [Oligoflexus sp.]HYX37511.1 hypothetical protein [Oligoflexus sp.]